jgi:SAM-dependent methyltransferase
MDRANVKLKVRKLIKANRGIKLDIGAGENRQPGFLTMDIRPLPNIDIVWDIQKFPYPIPDNSCHKILMSHIWEHIEPKYRIVMVNELWRIMKHDGELWLSCPYYLSFGAYQDPSHYPCPTEATFTYFDPNYPLWNVYKPRPWKLVRNDYQAAGSLEIIMTAIKKVKLGKDHKAK